VNPPPHYLAFRLVLAVAILAALAVLGRLLTDPAVLTLLLHIVR
jgi:hypothetical protein